METLDTVSAFREEDAKLFDSLLDDVRVMHFRLLVLVDSKYVCFEYG